MADIFNTRHHNNYTSEVIAIFHKMIKDVVW